MTQIGVTAIEAAPEMMTTMKSDLGPILEKFGMEATEIKTMLDAIKEEDVRSFASEMSAELSKSNNEMICGGKSTCKELTSFQAKVEAENDNHNGLLDNGGERIILSSGAIFLTIF